MHCGKVYGGSMGASGLASGSLVGLQGTSRGSEADSGGPLGSSGHPLGTAGGPRGPPRCPAEPKMAPTLSVRGGGPKQGRPVHLISGAFLALGGAQTPPEEPNAPLCAPQGPPGVATKPPRHGATKLTICTSVPGAGCRGPQELSEASREGSGRLPGSADGLRGPPEGAGGHPRSPSESHGGSLDLSGASTKSRILESDFSGCFDRDQAAVRSCSGGLQLSEASREASGRPPGSAGGLREPPGGSGGHPRSRSPASGPRFGVGHVVVRSGALHWCRRCGAYAEHRFKSLKAPCSGHPGKGPRAGQLGRLLRGLHPLTREPIPRPVGL